jgi:hypothetical protein
VLLAIALGSPLPTGQSAITRDTADAALFEWALGRFDLAGLELPNLEVEFHDELDPCHGYYGSFTNSDPVQVDLCGFNNDRFLPAPKKMILHELAHAWLFHNLDEETKTSFLELRGLRAWNDQDSDWAERGFEHAAEVIAWARLDDERRIVTIGDSHPDLFSEAYTLLTSLTPPDR